MTAHSVLLFSLPPLISSFLRGNSGQGPIESSWSSSSVSVLTGRSSVPPAFPLRSLPPSLLQRTHCRWPEKSHQYPPVEPVTTPPPLPPRSPPQKSCIWQPLWPPTSTAGLLSFPPPHQPLLPSAPRTHSRQRYTLIISTAFFRLGAPAASPPGAPKHSGTCASSFPYSSSASPPSRQPLSCSLPWQLPPSIIQA